MRKSLALLLLAALPLGSIAATPTTTWVGDWDARASNGSITIPFHFSIQSGKGGGLVARFYNGEDVIDSPATKPKDGHLLVHYDAIARVLDLSLQADGSLAGTYQPSSSATAPRIWHIQAQHAHGAELADDHAPDVDGLWLLPAKSKKANEHAWRLITHQDFGKLSASVLGVGGDSGALTGVWKNGQWTLSNFSGTRAELATLKPGPAQGGAPTLQLVLTDAHGQTSTYTAYRPEAAKKLGLPDAADLSTHTGVRDPDERFTFSFKDLDGHTVSSSDARFRNKVVLVDISGSWCPNCHDEAPFLDALYRKYHAQGLEIVTLDFEDEDDYANPARLRAFIKQYHPAFPVLLAGKTDQAQEKIPQAVNLDSWPTTFFVGRDGRVKHVHTGFSAAATGQFHTDIQQEFDQQIQTLLAQKAG